jgi:regulator of RNase E activity RraA
MVIIIDLVGDEETVVLGGEAKAKETEDDARRRKQLEREVMERMPVPQVVPVSETGA